MSDINESASIQQNTYSTNYLNSQIISFFQQLKPQFQVKYLQEQSILPSFSVAFKVKNEKIQLLVTLKPLNKSPFSQFTQFQINLKLIKQFLTPYIKNLLKQVTKLQFLKLINQTNMQNLSGYQIYIQQDFTQCQNIFYIRKILKVLNVQKIKQYFRQSISIYRKFFYSLQRFIRQRQERVINTRKRLKEIKQSFNIHTKNSYNGHNKLVFKNILSFQIVKNQDFPKEIQEIIQKTKTQMIQLLTKYKYQQSKSTKILRSIQFKKKSQQTRFHTSTYSILSKIFAQFKNVETILPFRQRYDEEQCSRYLKSLKQNSEMCKNHLACKQIMHYKNQQQIKRKSAEAALKNQKEFLLSIQAQKNMHIGRYYFDVKEYENIANNAKAKIYLDWEETDFQNFLQKSTKLNLLDYLNFGIQILKGLYFIHDKGFIHRDLKLTNILVTKNMTLRLIDFGSVYLSYIQTQDQNYRARCSKFDSKPRFTQGYHINFDKIKKSLPQLIRKYKYDSKSYNRHEFFDMYSFGTIFKMLVLRLKQQFDDLDGQIQENLSYIIKTTRQVNPADRISPIQAIILLEQLKIFVQQYNNTQQDSFS